jgi:fructuronate reductase
VTDEIGRPPPRLGPWILSSPAPALRLPDYDRSKATTGIVHLGLGAFHRAHQAVYTDSLLAADIDRKE